MTNLNCKISISVTEVMQEQGLRGLLCADDWRNNYYLSPDFDPSVEMRFLKTERKQKIEAICKRLDVLGYCWMFIDER